MRILITGGAGFIGSNFVNYWLRSHPADQVVVVDKLTYAGHLENLAEAQQSPRFTFVQADICDYDAMAQAMQGVDCVAHFAAETHVDRSLAGLDFEKLFMRTNYDGTATLLHAAKAAGVGRFHHVSTDEVFGELDYDSPEKFHETFPLHPHNPYSISKAASDFTVRSFFRRTDLPVTISNCTNNYGPYMTPEKMIPRSIALLLAGDRVKLYTNADGVPGPNVRDWLYVEDHCRAIDLILRNGRAGETYCVGGNSELTNYRLVEKMLAVMSEVTGQAMRMATHVEFVTDRPGHDRRYAMDTSKIERELGWRPTFSFEQGFRATVDWYMSQAGREWLGKMQAATRAVRSGQDDFARSLQ